MKCHTDCVYNQSHECSRHTDHLLQAKCKDRTVLRTKANKSHCSESDKTSIHL